MNQTKSKLDPDLIYSLYTGVFKPQLVRIALQLDLFSLLEDGPADAQTVADACGCSATGIRHLLDFLSSLDVLERHGGEYALTPTAAAFLVPQSGYYTGDWILANTDPQLWQEALKALRSGRPSYREVPFEQDAWLESYSPWRPEMSMDMWRAAGIEPTDRPGLRVLDLACGCAIKSLVLAKTDPSMQVTCVDKAEVLESTRDLTMRLDLATQVNFLPGDINHIEFKSEGFDVALLGQVTYILSPKQNMELFKRVYNALTHEGTLVLDAVMTVDEPTEEMAFVSFLMWTLNGGGAHSFNDYSTWLREAGFLGVKQLSERWLSATK
jgi:SAM-dependent methyltransferase